MLMEAEQSNTIITRISTIELKDNDLLEISISKDQELEKSDIVDIINSAEVLGNGKRLKHLYIIDERTLPSQEARILSCSEYGSRFKKADAIVVTSLSQRMIFNFMINVEGTSVPSRLFSNRDEAILWLNSL